MIKCSLEESILNIHTYILSKQKNNQMHTVVVGFIVNVLLERQREQNTMT